MDEIVPGHETLTVRMRQFLILAVRTAGISSPPRQRFKPEIGQGAPQVFQRPLPPALEPSKRETDQEYPNAKHHEKLLPTFQTTSNQNMRR